MPALEDTIVEIVQRTGTTFDLTDSAARTRYARAINTDLATIIDQLNNVYKPLVEALVQTNTVEPLDEGLTGVTIYTDAEATGDSAAAYYDSSLSRPRSIKETFDVLLTEIGNIQNIVSVTASDSDWEDTIAALQDSLDTINLNLEQLRIDCQGANYTFDSDGEGDLTYPLAQHIDALGAFFTNFPGIGNTYVDTYPTLELEVLLSQVTIDTTLAQSVITNLSDDLDAIRDFMGMDTVGPETPTYSDHGDIVYVEDGQTLEEAVQVLDEAVAAVTSELSATFPGDVTGFERQAFSKDYLVIGEYPAGGSSDITLTFDGAVASASNIFVVDPHSSVFLIAEWVLHLSDGTSPVSFTNVNGLVGRVSSYAICSGDDIVLSTPDLNSFSEMSYFNAGIQRNANFIGPAGQASVVNPLGDNATCYFEDSAVTTRGLVLKFQPGASVPALGLDGRVVARVRWVQVRYNGT